MPKLFGVIDKTGKIWDIEAQGAEVKTFLDDPAGKESSAFDVFHCYPDLSYAIRFDERAQKHWLRNLSTGEEIERVTNFCTLGYAVRNNIPNMVFSDDYQLFAMDNEDENQNRGNHLLVWDAATGSDICTVPLSYKLTAMTFLPKSRTLVTVCDPNPKIPHAVWRKDLYIPFTTPMRKPVAKTQTRTIIEFWDIGHLIWHKEKVNLFPRKIKTCYLEGNEGIYSMTASQDGKLLYMRSDKHTRVQSGHIWSDGVAGGYVFWLDPNESLDLPAEIRPDDNAVTVLQPPLKESQ